MDAVVGTIGKSGIAVAAAALGNAEEEEEEEGKPLIGCTALGWQSVSNGTPSLFVSSNEGEAEEKADATRDAAFSHSQAAAAAAAVAPPFRGSGFRV